MLHRVIDGTLTPFDVGPFTGCPSVTDIAVSRAGEVIAIGYDDIYSINENNGACTWVASLDVGGMNALGFAPAEGDPNGEVLYAMGGSEVYRIDDPTTGEMTYVGSLGGFFSAGDIVWVPGFGLMGSAGGGSDTSLLLIDVNGGEATLVGESLSGTLGLAVRDGVLLGFSSGGGMATIDPMTGATDQFKDTGIAFWGAGAALE